MYLQQRWPAAEAAAPSSCRRSLLLFPEFISERRRRLIVGQSRSGAMPGVV